MSNDDSFDLTIENYNFQELLHLFKMDWDFDLDEDLNDFNNDSNDFNKQYLTREKCDTIDTLLKNIKENFSYDIYVFFVKVKTIILTIFLLIESNDIQPSDISPVLTKINSIPHLENLSEEQVLKKIKFDKNDKIKTTSKKKNSDSLNTPYYNLHSGRINPDLNDKNNTNIIYNTAPNEIYPGDLNSVKRITQLFNVNLNSCFRNNYFQSNPCDFLYILPSEIKNVVAMRLVSIEIPNAWYLFSSLKKNNIFEIVVSTKEQNRENAEFIKKSVSYKIVIPDGNYDCDTLQEYLNETYFFESDLESNLHANNLLRRIKFSIDKQSLKSKFEILEKDSDASRMSISVHFSQETGQNMMNTVGWILGFRLGNYIDIYHSFISEGLFDAGGDRYIYLSINDFQYNSNTSNMVCFDKSILNENILAKIPMRDGKLSLIVNDNNHALVKLRRYNGPITLSRLQIKIFDQFGSVIDLNHMDYSLTLELQILYENFNFKNVTA